MATMMETSDTPPYPIRLTIVRPESQSRILNLPLLIGTMIRILLLIPSLVVIAYLAYACVLAVFIAFWGILFTGRYPRGLFKLIVGGLRWQTNLSVYLSHLTDEYPPMDLDDRPDRQVHLEVDYPTEPSRWLNLPFLPIKLILIIPNLIVLYLVAIIAGVLGLIAHFAILFTGNYPAGLYNFVAGVARWNARLSGYLAGFTDKYPPFSMN